MTMRWVFVLLVVCCGCAAPSQVFIDAYVGANIPVDGDVEIGTIVTQPNFDGIATGGARAGVYFDVDGPIQPGLAFDVSASAQEIGSVDFTLIPISFLFMAKVPLGLVEPYVGFGPTIAVSTFDLSSGVPGSDADSVDIGLDFRLGATVMLTDSLGVFGEYRLTYAEPQFDFGGVSVDVESLTNHLLFGVSLRF